MSGEEVDENMPAPAGEVTRGTALFEGCCSIQLSYGR